MSESGWKDLKTKMWARIKEIEKVVPSYDYSDKHHMMSTDEKFTEVIHDELRKSKKILFNILETSYEQQKESLTKDIHKLRDDIDIFLDEVKIKNVNWPDKIPEEFLEKIVIHDSEIIMELPKLNSQLEDVQGHVLNMEKPGTSLFDREEMEKLHAKISEIKKHADSLVRLFKEREMLVNLRHIRREREYDEMRSEIEAKF